MHRLILRIEVGCVDHRSRWDQDYRIKIDETDHQRQRFFEMPAQLESAQRNAAWIPKL
jgi:Spy/CpxP family protein refolding chaperone